MFLIVDCNYLCYVNRSILSVGLSYKGGPTEIIYGFLKSILSLSNQFKTKQFIFCWDSRESIRKKIYAPYKANRTKDLTEEEKESNQRAYIQFDKIKKLLPEMGFNNVFEEEGYESDDLIASLVLPSKTITPVECPVFHPIVVSSDKDLYQLLDWCSLYNITKKETYTKDLFIREYGIRPSRWKKIKSIAGCGSDNVKGLEGVGEKTVIKYLKGELKEETKTWQRIHTYDSRLTEKLVSLPFEGCVNLREKIRKDNCTPDKFTRAFQKYGCQSLLDHLDKWEAMFV